MKSEHYFQNSQMTRAALARYAEFASGKGEKSWSIAESKLSLYRHSVTAFASTADESTKRSRHETVFGHLRSWWGVGRNGTLWNAATAFDVLTNRCQACSRGNGLDLTTLGDRPSQQDVLACLSAMRGLKRLSSGKYPVMAVSKNLHFFNPSLFVIYDNDVVLKKVYRGFRKDWNSFYDGITADPGDECIRFYLAYLLWASHMIRNAHPALMEDFAAWFIETVSEEESAENFRDELRMSYATAFEFIVIGAASLEADGALCLCG